jgi:hypothetical protein
VQTVEPSLDAPASSGATPAAPVVTEYFIDHGSVRIGGSAAKTVFLFSGKTMTVVDNIEGRCHLLQRATNAQFLAHYADEVHRLEQAASAAAPAERADAQHKAQVMHQISDRLQTPIQRDLRVTVRFDAVDGRTCRIWEEWENGAKRLEICVAPEPRVPGGGEILAAMQTLSQFHEGGQFALGVDFGFSDWWPDLTALNGVPLLIHEYKYDSLVSEIRLERIRNPPPPALAMQAPADCRRQDGPDYTSWYVR